jgi:uncharacterized protein (DUF302 family)
MQGVSTSSRVPYRFWMTGAVAVVAASLGGGRSVLAEEHRQHTSTRSSRFNVAETVQRLEASVHRRGLGVFACIEQPSQGPSASQATLVVVLESSQGGTPVLMRGDGLSSESDVPLSLVVRPVSDDASEVIFPTDFGQWEDWQDLPQELAAELAELPAVVADALA